jgi:hypothetical protein
MHHHAAEFLAQIFFWLSLHGGPVPPTRSSLEQLEAELSRPTVESVLATLDVNTWKREAK